MQKLQVMKNSSVEKNFDNCFVLVEYKDEDNYHPFTNAQIILRII
jgi:hypothetical protein